MATVGKLNVILSASSAQFHSAMGRAQASIKTMQVQASGLAQSLGLALGSQIGKGVKLAADFEQAGISFEVMTKSAETAQRLMADITQFAAATPFKTAELVQASKLLLGFGTSAEDIIPTMRMLGDVASGSGQQIGDIGLIYGQVMAKGRLQGEELLQFAERGVPMMAQLQKQFGVTGAVLSKMIEQGKVSFADLQRAFVDMTTGQGQFSGMMERQSKSLAGLMSTLSDNIDNALMKFAGGMLQMLDAKGAVESLSSAVNALASVGLDTLAVAWQKNGTEAKNFGAIAVDSLEGVTMALAKVKDAWESVGWGVHSTSAGFSDMLADSLEWIREDIGWIQDLKTSLRVDAGKSRMYANQTADDPKSETDKVRGFFDEVRRRMATQSAASMIGLPSIKGVGQGFFGQFVTMANTYAKQVEKIMTKSRSEMFGRAESIFEQTRTPMEEFEAKMQEVNTLFSMKMLDDPTRLRARSMYLKQLMDAENKGVEQIQSPMTAAKLERRFDFTVPFAQQGRQTDPARLLEQQKAIAEKTLTSQQKSETYQEQMVRLLGEAYAEEGI